MIAPHDTGTGDEKKDEVGGGSSLSVLCRASNHAEADSRSDSRRRTLPVTAVKLDVATQRVRVPGQCVDRQSQQKKPFSSFLLFFSPFSLPLLLLPSSPS